MNYIARQNRPDIIKALVVMFILSLIVSKCAKSQSIGLDLITSQIQHYQPGISVAGKKTGAYINFISTESANEDHHINRGVSEYKGFVIGCVIISSKVDHFSGISIGAGAIDTHYYDTHHKKDSWKFLGELRCNINICKGVDVIAGINTEPWIIYGIRIYAFK